MAIISKINEPEDHNISTPENQNPKSISLYTWLTSIPFLLFRGISRSPENDQNNGDDDRQISVQLDEDLSITTTISAFVSTCSTPNKNCSPEYSAKEQNDPSPPESASDSQRSCLEKKKESYPFDFPGESSRNSSIYSISSSNITYNPNFSYPEMDHPSTSSSFSFTTNGSTSPIKPYTPNFSPKNSSPESTLEVVIHQTPQDQVINNPQELRVENVFQKQELAKQVVIFTVAFSIGVMSLHYTSPKTITWKMSITIVSLLSVGVALLWNSNLFHDDFPLQAHRIQMLGFSLCLASFFGLIAMFVWPSYTVIIPISSWIISALVLAYKAFKFRSPEP